MSDGFDTYVWGAILLLTLCSLLTRSSYMVFGDRFPLPDSVRRALRYAPVAALIAIVIPELFPLTAQVSGLVNPRSLAAGAAILLFVYTHSTLAIILGGMAVLWAIQALVHLFF